jgi:hypothetical protein
MVRSKMKKTVAEWGKIVVALEDLGETSEHQDGMFELAYDIEQDILGLADTSEMEIELTSDQVLLIQYADAEL